MCLCFTSLYCISTINCCHSYNRYCLHCRNLWEIFTYVQLYTVKVNYYTQENTRERVEPIFKQPKNLTHDLRKDSWRFSVHTSHSKSGSTHLVFNCRLAFKGSINEVTSQLPFGFRVNLYPAQLIYLYLFKFSTTWGCVSLPRSTTWRGRQ